MTATEELHERAVLRVNQLMSACIGVMLDGGKPSESEWVADAKEALLCDIAALAGKPV